VKKPNNQQKGGEVKQKTGAGQGYYLLMLFMMLAKLENCTL